MAQVRQIQRRIHGQDSTPQYQAHTELGGPEAGPGYKDYVRRFQGQPTRDPSCLSSAIPILQ